MFFFCVVFCVLLDVTSKFDLNFPSGFKFGVASSSFQIEGAWNVSDKSESIWDRCVHSHPNKVIGGGNADVACDSYHNWRRDVQMLQEMGMSFYRFSISWPRLLPNAFSNKISESGSKYYNDLIDALLEKGIEPIITLYHWELPQKLQDLGGWTNPHISDWFADYARVVFSLYADRVKIWITINEPLIMCDFSYSMATYAPLIQEPEIAGQLCGKNVIIAHSKAFRIYEKEFKPLYHGKMAIGNIQPWIEPKSADDEEIAELTRQGGVGKYSHPIYSKEGGWPPMVEAAMAEYSKRAGYPRSKLPAFTPEEISLVRGTYDFYNINYYGARLARPAGPGENVESFLTGHPEFGVVLEIDPTWPIEGHDEAPSYPEGLRKNVAWLRKQYGDLEFFIGENGCLDSDRNDYIRMGFIRSHLKQVLLSIKEDGANITGFTFWSLMDNFEWFYGYCAKFGLYEVDFNDPMRTRTPRASVHYYSHIIKKHSLDVPFPMSKVF